MKKLLIICVTLLFSPALFAQATKHHTAYHPASNVHCYAMKDGAMVQCLGDKGEPMTQEVTLRNGTHITTAGEVSWTNGQKATLVNGQAVDKRGNIGDFNKMHAGKMKQKNKAK